MADFNENNLCDLLPLYYQRIFPFSQFYKWLSYGNKKMFAQREMSFTLLDDIYLRYQSFQTQEAFMAEIRKRNPIKIDIGAVYNVMPSDRRIARIFTPLEKELVFDIDMTDYDDIRMCCSGTLVCLKCWKFITIACKILDKTLRNTFNFQHMLWVFSGRRGVHLWVCDEHARKLTDTQREAITGYINFISKKSTNSMYGDRIHSQLRNALTIIEDYFVEVALQDQDVLGTDEKIANFLKPFEADLRKTFEEAMKKGKNSEEKWNIFDKLFEQNLVNKKVPYSLRSFREAMKLHFTYPRIDINVSHAINHLLKAPFCVHPKTGKVCIPFSIKLVGKFDPNKVPKINELVDEINAYDAKTKEQEAALNESKTEEGDNKTKKIKDYKKTSLLKPINTFEEFLRSLETKDIIKSGPMEF